MTASDPTTTRVDESSSFDEAVHRLSMPCAFPGQAADVDVRQTHISAVFLGSDVVYKLKKPVKLPFLDFSTVQLRHHFCNEEVRINRPWAPGVYLGVVPVTTHDGGLQFEGDGPMVDWAVKMRRLPESVTLRSRLNDGSLVGADLDRVARRIAAVHKRSVPLTGDEATLAVSTFRRQLEDNWTSASDLPEVVIDHGVLHRIKTLAAKWLDQCGELLQARAEQGWIREVHGDLRLEHVFYFPERSLPDDIVILDGIEFDPGLRRIDTVADIAFLTMELSFLGYQQLSEMFAAAYFDESGDSSGQSILPLFAAYRSAVRAKVAAILGSENEIPQVDRDRALARSRGHWLWCLSELERPGLRPALVLVCGLPGTGKSTVSRTLATNAQFEVIRSDVVRKVIFPEDSTSNESTTLYSSDRTQQVYDECLRQAQRILFTGGRVIVDATFQRDQNRQAFIQLAIDAGIRVVWIECLAPPEITKQRIDARRGDASDADWSVYQLVKARWEQPSEFTARFHSTIETGQSSEQAATAALATLREREIAE